MTVRVLVPIADGSEEIEACCIINVLRRGGVDVTVASIKSILKITGAREIQIVADALLSDCKDSIFDMIVLPGGLPGAENLRDSEILTTMLNKQVKEDRWYGAICASPAVVLAHHGWLAGKKATAYPPYQASLPDSSQAQKTVVIDGKCVTSQSPGTALEFGLTLLKVLVSQEASEKVRKDLVFV